MPSKLIVVALLTLCGLLTANAVRLSLANAESGRVRYPALRRLPSPPYTIEKKETILDDAGLSHSGGTYIQAVRGDGSYVLWTEASDDGVLNTQVSGRRIVLMPDTQIDTDDLRRMKSTITTAVSPLLVRDADAGCLIPYERPVAGEVAPEPESVVENETTIRGLRVHKITHRVGVVGWYAPDLGCAELKTRTEVKGQVVTQEVALLVPGEPDPSLFDTAALTEVLPSVLRKVTDPQKANVADVPYLRFHKDTAR